MDNPIPLRFKQSWEQLERALDLTFYLKIALYIFAYYVLSQFAFAAIPLDEPAYHQPVIALEALRDANVLLVLLPSLLLVLLNYVKFGGNRFLSRWSWETFNEGISVKYFVFLLAVALAWAFSTYDFNFYYNQGHLIDRLLLVALAILILRNPVFVPLFTFYSIVVVSQFNYPELLNFSWFDKQLLFKILLLFSILVYWRLFSKVPLFFFLFLALCLIGAEYFHTGVSKLLAGNRAQAWVLDNPLHNLFVSSYINGWLGSVDQQTILRVAEVMKWLDIPMQLFTLIAELAAIFLLFGRRLAIVIFAGVVILHLGIFMASGIFFWKWIVLDVGLMIVLWKYRSWVNEFLFNRRNALLSLVVIYFGYLYFSPTPAGWFDTRVNNYYEFEAVDVNGDVYPLSRGFWVPYDIPFVQDQFFFLSDDRILVGTYGTQRRFDLAQAINKAETADEIEAVLEGYGSIRYSEAQTRAFDDFVITFFRNANARMNSDVVPPFLRPPHHISTFPPENAYHFQAPVRTVRIRFLMTFYNDDTIVVLRNRIIREIEID